MADRQPHILVTGASGQLGQLVLEQLQTAAPEARIAGTVRNAAAGEHLAVRGAEVRLADYTQPETLDAALTGVDRVLLISSNVLGQRVAQHRNVIEAARRARVKLLAYTSLLHADSSPLGLADEHLQTEAMVRASGLPFVILRNGWYTQNYTAGIPAALTRGALLGGAGAGRISSAPRAEYAAGAAAVLAAPDAWTGQALELAGDEAYTLAELAAEVAHRSGRPFSYADLPEAEYKAALVGAGLPEPIAAMLADSAVAAAGGALFDDSRQLSRLIGRPTTPMAVTVAETLAGL